MKRPAFDSNERVVNGVAWTVFIAALVAAGVWFYQTFLQAETAIAHVLGGK